MIMGTQVDPGEDPRTRLGPAALAVVRAPGPHGRTRVTSRRPRAQATGHMAVSPPTFRWRRHRMGPGAARATWSQQAATSAPTTATWITLGGLLIAVASAVLDLAPGGLSLLTPGATGGGGNWSFALPAKHLGSLAILRPATRRLPPGNRGARPA